MAGGNRMGPNNQGPMTGRAMGYCAGYSVPGFTNPDFGSGRGFRRWGGKGLGRGRGFGRGFGRMTIVNPRGLPRPRFWRFAAMPDEQAQAQQTQPEPQPYQVWGPTQIQQPAYQLTKAQEIQMLEEEAKAVEQEQKTLAEDFEEIRKRLEELRK